MFHYQHGVALIAQLLQVLVQAMYIARVQTHARLIENIHHIHQAAAQMLDHLDTLRLAARKCVGFAAQAQIFQASVDHILQALGQGGDHRRSHRVFDGLQDFNQLADFHGSQIGDVVTVNATIEHRLVETCAVAHLTRPKC